MGKKESLAIEYVELKKKFDGDEFKPRLIIHQIPYLIKHFSVASLEEKIEAVKSCIDAKEHRLKVEEYYKTEEGLKIKKNIEERKAFLIDIRKKIIKSVENDVQKYLDENIGDGWTNKVTNNFNYIYVDFGLKPVTPKYIKDNCTFEFGHEFNISYDHDYGKDRYEMNYGTLGPFDLDNNSIRPKYLLGMGKICSDKKFITELKNRLINVNSRIMEIRTEIDNLDNTLKNPKL